MDNTSLPRSAAGLIETDEYACIKGCENTYVAGDVGSYPGPDWQAKLGVNAEIQAGVAATNLANSLQAMNDPKKVITHQLIYVIDSLDRGVLVKRNEKMSKMLPPVKFFHYSKRIMEYIHLAKLR